MFELILAYLPFVWLTTRMTSGHRPRVAIVGSAQTQLRSAHRDRQHVDLIAEAVTQALLGTGLTIAEVDFVIDSGSDFLDGRSISNCGFLGAMGAHHKEESRIEEDGLWALTYAASKLLGGTGSVGLVIAYSKSSESDPRDYWSTLAEPFTQRPVGLDHRSAAGLYAQRYLRKHQLDASDLRRVSDRAWSRAAARDGNDADTVDLDTPEWDEQVATPLTLRDFARPVDGAVAVVVATDHVARQIGRESVWITGIGSAIDQHFLAAREPSSLPAAEAAARSAYRMAGIDSAADFDIVEVSAGSTVGELMVVEALGLAEAGSGLDCYADDGHAGLNVSGGALPADPVMATGLVRLHEVVGELAGRSPSADGSARRGLAHGTGGLGMQNHCVVTMERA
jgi:acetyl-CoA C-acetyltransferase